MGKEEKEDQIDSSSKKPADNKDQKKKDTPKDEKG